MKTAILAFCLLAACGSNPAANPCATKGATYLFHFVEDPSGTCGPVPDSIVNVGSDGTIASSSSLTCDKTELDGCTSKKSNCKTTTSTGIQCTVNTSSTFSSDGSSVTGLESFTCTSGASVCSSTYSVTASRQ